MVRVMVDRYRFLLDPWAGCNCEMVTHDKGDWIEYSEYKMLLDKYEAAVARAEYAEARLEAGQRISMAYEPSGSGEGRGPYPTGQGFGKP